MMLHYSVRHRCSKLVIVNECQLFTCLYYNLEIKHSNAAFCCQSLKILPQDLVICDCEARILLKKKTHLAQLDDDGFPCVKSEDGPVAVEGKRGGGS